MEKISVLITGVGGPGGPGIIKSLRLVRERKIRIIGVDMDKDSAAFALADKHYLVPSGTDKNFISEILRIALKEKIKVILPLVTNELMKLSQCKQEFGRKGIEVSISDPQSLKIANNKYLLMSHCKKINVPTPEFILAKNFREFKEAIFNLDYPKNNVCFKPPISRGMRGFRILTEKKDRFDLLMSSKPGDVFTTFQEIELVLKNVAKFPELIVMEYLPGDEYSVDILANNGEPIFVIPRLRKKVKLGVSFIGVTVNDKEIIKYSQKIVDTLKLNGNIGLQFKKDEAGTAKIIESNPRLQGTTVLCTAAGANLVYLAMKLALGEKIVRPKIKWGTKMIRYWQEQYYDKTGLAFTL